MSIERDFDVPLIAEMALREKQIQQNYRPIIGVHKWFARRPGTLFRGLILSEFGEGRLEDTFFRSNDFPGIRIADPFMGGGTPLIEANRVGCDVQGFDVNPMSAWIVREEIEYLDTAAYERVARALVARLRDDIDGYYRTSCPLYGDGDVPVKSFLWVKVLECGACGKPFDLFPGYLLAENRRHPKNVLVCPGCGDLNEVEDRKSPGDCIGCGTALRQAGPARRGRCNCPHCGHSNLYPGQARQPLAHRLFAIEYHNPRRRAEHRGRFFKKPDAEDIARMAAAADRWEQVNPRHVPGEDIPPGDETGRLHRWGYARYRDMFNPRQLLGLELSCRLIAEIEDQRIRHALATNLSDLLRYQNMLCRYDTMALKSLDIFSVHGFRSDWSSASPTSWASSTAPEPMSDRAAGPTSSTSTSRRSAIARRRSKSGATARATSGFRSRARGSAKSSTAAAARSPSVARARPGAGFPHEAWTPCSRTRPISATCNTAS